MGRVASAGDNAAMESFHALLQKNVLDRRRWRTRAELRYAILTWIEHTYNRRRRQRALGKLTPLEYELAFTPTKTPAPQHDQSQPTLNCYDVRTGSQVDRIDAAEVPGAP